MDTSDPAGLRYTDTYRVIEHLAHDPDQLRDDTCTVVAFAGSATTLGPLRLGSRAGRRFLKGFLRRLPAIDPGTELEAAVAAAGRALDQAPPDSRRVVILVTDGEVFLDADQLTDVLAALGEAEWHLIAADYNGTFASNADVWAAAPLASVRIVRRPRSGELAGALASAAHQALGRGDHNGDEP
jgi:hypothetical protein